MDFLAHGIVRVAAVSPALEVGAVSRNADEILAAWENAAGEGASLVVFPELSLCGYTCGDLLADTTLRRSALSALEYLAAHANLPPAIVGLPFALHGRLFNMAAVIAGGHVRGLVPKSYLPTYGEFYEQRWFTSAFAMEPTEIDLMGEKVPVGTDLLFCGHENHDVVFGVEICEDLWATQPPSGELALQGATVLANPSASNELLGKVDYRRDLVRQQSARCLAAYVYAGCGPGESTTDTVYSGHCVIAENGRLLAQNERFDFATNTTFADVDVGSLLCDRLRHTTFRQAPRRAAYRRVPVSLNGEPRLPLRRPLRRHPFVPPNPALRRERCAEIFSIQANSLAKRMRHIGLEKLTIGVSGGLDSTLALLVAVEAFAVLELPLSGIIGVSMPGFGTTERTKSNGERLMEELGVTPRTISIEAAVRQHFADIDHDPEAYDVTFENAQARERTQILMDLANQEGGLVLGTGDLSESALGWCTYNADHMSMYHVNIGVPKTLVRYLIGYCAEEKFSGAVAEILVDIGATPITPELLPHREGEIVQKTEETIGQYELHDFFLFHFIRYGAGPEKILFLACQAFAGKYAEKDIRETLYTFFRRFFSQQFKRSCLPDGPKVGTVALSPRADWRMPSDMRVEEWLRALED